MSGREPAWAVRDYEHQQFVRRWDRRLLDESEVADKSEAGDDETFLWDVAALILGFLRSQHPNTFSSPTMTAESASNFWREMQEDLQKFGRSEVERAVVAAMFFERCMLPHLLSHFHSEALRERLQNPQLVLKANSLSEEIPFNPSV